MMGDVETFEYEWRLAGDKGGRVGDGSEEDGVLVITVWVRLRGVCQCWTEVHMKSHRLIGLAG